MRKLLKKIWNDETGNVLIVAGASLPLFLGAAGLATDTIQWTLWKRQLQRAADSAAIAGVYERIQVGADTTKVGSAVNRDLDLNHHTGIDLRPGFPEVSLLDDDGQQVQRVQVRLRVKRPLAFSGLFLDDAPDITATAIAASVPGNDDYCVVSLEDTAQAGIIGSGTTSVEMDCGMVTNSVSANSAIARGSANMMATVIASVGGIQQSDNWLVEKYDPYVSKQSDPFANVNPDPDDMNCDPTAGMDSDDIDNGAGNDRGGTGAMIDLDEDTDLSSLTNGYGEAINCFASLSVGSNQSLTLPAGVYYISGGDINIQGSLTGEGVTLVLTNKDTASNATIGEFDMNAQGSLDLTAPTSGTFEGIAVFQDRRASFSTRNKINGGSTGGIDGALYFPNQGLTFNGGNATDAKCTRFVTRRIHFTGNAGLNIKRECDDIGVPTFQGGRLIRLVG